MKPKPTIREEWEGVERVEPLADIRLHSDGVDRRVKRAWDAEIVEQKPYPRHLKLDFDPEGIAETAADKLGFVPQTSRTRPGPFQGLHRRSGRRDGRLAGRVDRQAG